MASALSTKRVVFLDPALAMTNWFLFDSILEVVGHPYFRICLKYFESALCFIIQHVVGQSVLIAMVSSEYVV